ncbi:uncharacterized protein LOC142590322 isoform X1 [Dermacentor variabilis]|uniref:uncharacterized protein LOC142590322 isoform X1 n=1 Tax=Dermacentor variabilis TaxID=34621 RepID=UPI003F5C2E70
MAIDSRQQTTLVRQRCTLACVASGSGDPRVVKRRLAACLYSCHLFKKMTKFLAIIVAFLFATGLSCNMVNGECWFNFTKIKDGGHYGLERPCIGIVCNSSMLQIQDCDREKPRDNNCVHRAPGRWPACCKLGYAC